MVRTKAPRRLVDTSDLLVVDMKKCLSLIFVLFACAAQAQDVNKLIETAQVFVTKEDYANARLVLNRAIQLQPNDYMILQELAYVDFLSGEIDEAVTVINKVIDDNAADVKSFQIAGMIYKAGNLLKECERVYKKGLKKFPKSGVLLSELGEIYLLQKAPGEAIKYWEEGIDKDPAFAGNYFHAAKFYFFTKSNPILSILYGEIFINAESYTVRTAEMKSILLESYKLFYSGAVTYDEKKSNPFQKAIAETLLKQKDVTTMGITTDVLTMIRLRFVLDWYNNYAAKYPHKLLDQLRFLAREGLFDAYNQWIFGVATNVVQYQYWASANPKASAEFTNFQKSRIFRMPEGQNYK